MPARVMVPAHARSTTHSAPCFCASQYGGAKYIPTGRGYAIKHNTFVKVGAALVAAPVRTNAEAKAATPGECSSISALPRLV